MWWALWAAWIFVILGITVLPLENFVGHTHWDQVSWTPFFGHRLELYDIVGNMVMFIPFGYFLRRAATPRTRKRAWVLTLLLAAGVSTGLEFYQVFCHNRIPSTTDICSNFFGAIIGGLLSEST
ncbi:MAG: VanZ family protein [Deltaproteobacteria bacterium]|nr:VanZ family protein [Deltaproteobacteria bacterium]